MPLPEITEPDQVALALGETQQSQTAKRLVKVEKPYKTEPGFYQRALDAAAAKLAKERGGES